VPAIYQPRRLNKTAVCAYQMQLATGAQKDKERAERVQRRQAAEQEEAAAAVAEAAAAAAPPSPPTPLRSPSKSKRFSQPDTPPSSPEESASASRLRLMTPTSASESLATCGTCTWLHTHIL
jgi:hypothetical protein